MKKENEALEWFKGTITGEQALKGEGCKDITVLIQMVEQQKAKDDWKAIEEYINKIKNKIPFGLIISHGYSLDDRREWKEMRNRIFGKKKHLK